MPTRLPLGRKTPALADEVMTICEVMVICFENRGETPRGVRTAPLARRRWTDYRAEWGLALTIFMKRWFIRLRWTRC